jgi:class 3 adenylate cyclase
LCGYYAREISRLEVTMDTTEQDYDRRPKCRMDFTIEAVRTNDRTRMAYFTIVPDARRYTIIEHNGEKCYLDKYLKLLIPLDEMNENMVRQMPGLPLFSLSPTVKSIPEYASSRRTAIAENLSTGQYIPPTESAMPHRRFEDNPRPRDIAFLSVDICGSSKRRKSNPEAFDRAYEILFRELGTVVGQFNGAVLTPTGDGFIAIVDYPAFTCQCDTAIDLGLSLLVVLRNAVNPALNEAGLDPMQIRIGADYGPAQIRHLEIPPVGFSQDEIASDALNRACKIEKSANPSEFRVGRRLYELVHVQWLERAHKVPFDGATVGIPDYQVYRMT